MTLRVVSNEKSDSENDWAFNFMAELKDAFQNHKGADKFCFSLDKKINAPAGLEVRVLDYILERGNKANTDDIFIGVEKIVSKTSYCIILVKLTGIEKGYQFLLFRKERTRGYNWLCFKEGNVIEFPTMRGCVVGNKPWC